MTSPNHDALRRLDDLEEIRARIVRLARYADERRWDDYGALYAEDGMLVLPFGSWTGRPAIVARISHDLGGYAATQHISTSIDVELDGDTARARANFVATHVVSPDGLSFWRGGGAYRVELRRGPSGWLIGRFGVEPAWRSAHGTDFPQH